jgi:predicted DNA-binding transcriptional regulator
MDKRKSTGIFIFVACIVGFFIYAYLLMLSEWSQIVLQLSVLMIVGGVLGVISWIGYTMATTKPTPSSITSEDDKK